MNNAQIRFYVKWISYRRGVIVRVWRAKLIPKQTKQPEVMAN
jgi:hypothetical protein